MKRSHTRRLWWADHRSISCLAVVCLIIGASAVPSWLSGGDGMAYAAPETAQATESANTVTVNDNDFASLQKALRGAKDGTKTIISLSDDYVAPEGFAHIDLPAGSDVEISVPEGSSAVLSRADGGAATSGALLVLANKAASKLTISGDFTYRDSTTLAYVGSGDGLAINGGTYTGNATADGGVIYAYDATVTIDGGIFSGNKATDGSGGAIYLNGGSLSVKNATFSGNTAAKSNDA